MSEDPYDFPQFDDGVKPLVVDVNDGRWNAYAQNSPPSPQDEVLFKLLEAIGGISMSTPPGRYHFIAKGFGTSKVEITVSPVNRVEE